MKCVLAKLALAAVLLVPAAAALPATYYVDFDGGADGSAGDAPAVAFKHSPGDPEAKEKAANVKLQPGDKVLFKGGAIYRGNIVVRESGAEGNPFPQDKKPDIGAFVYTGE